MLLYRFFISFCFQRAKVVMFLEQGKKKAEKSTRIKLIKLISTHYAFVTMNKEQRKQAIFPLKSPPKVSIFLEAELAAAPF